MHAGPPFSPVELEPSPPLLRPPLNRVCVSFVKMKRKLEAADTAMEASHFCSDVHVQRAASSSGNGFTLEPAAAARVAPGVLWG